MKNDVFETARRPRRSIWLRLGLYLGLVILTALLLAAQALWLPAWTAQGRDSGDNTDDSSGNSIGNSIGRVLAGLNILPTLPTPLPSPASPSPAFDDDRRFDPAFTLRHVLHNNANKTKNYRGRLDVTPDVINRVRHQAAVAEAALGALGEGQYEESETTAALLTQALGAGFGDEYSIKAEPRTIRRLANRDPDFVESYLEYARTTVNPVAMDFEWSDDQVLVPNMTDKKTELALAFMAQDAYVDVPYEGDWLNVTDPYNASLGIGWMEDGVRGYVFADKTNSTVVVSIKGTSAAIFDSGGSTVANDKVNDNLLFSCCCARISYMWNTVCDCYTGDSYSCDQKCLEKELFREDRYYRTVLDIYRNVTALYPDAQIWAIGHSLGGSLASLLGRTFGIPSVSFEAPPERLASERLHLPMPPGIPPWEDHVWHIGHTADPVYMGACNGAGSACWVGGYAMETRCHTGIKCVYDTVEEKGWHLSMVNHRILVVIKDILTQYNTTAECKVAGPCQDCYNWDFYSGDEPSSTSTTTTQAATQTSDSATGSVTATADPSCVRRNWYGGCAEYATSTTTATTTTGSTSPTTTSKVSETKTSKSPKTTTSSTTSTTSPSTSTSTSKPPPTSTVTECPGPTGSVPPHCIERTWYGWCIEYGCDDE